MRPAPLQTLLILLLSCCCAAQPVLVDAHDPQTVVALASQRYQPFPLFGRLLLGSNYRAAWRTPVTLPVFYLSHSGLRLDRAGGSKQTNSLYLLDSGGRSWVLRSVDKDVNRGLPWWLQVTPFAGYKKAQVSGAYPYGALVAASLCRAAGIPAPDPVYYYVADEEALGPSRDQLGNTLCMLEQRDPTPDGSASFDTGEMQKALEKEGGPLLLQAQVLRARLLDMMLGDWDRHEGNWRWGLLDSAGHQYFYAIPRDRDFVLFSQGGILPFLMRHSAEPYLVGFEKSMRRLKQLNRKAWDFDRRLLASLTEKDWTAEIGALQALLTDAVLLQAVDRLPREVRAIDGDAMLRTLKLRRDGLKEGALRYFHFLQGRKEKRAADRTTETALAENAN
jgi:hypothetical protein